MMGATIQAQKHCQKTEGHHSHPMLAAAFFSAGVPWTSVPGMPKESWNLRDTTNMKRVRNSCIPCQQSQEHRWCVTARTYLETHAATYEREHLGGVVERAPLLDERLFLTAGSAVGSHVVPDEALLHLGDIEEP